MPEHNQTGLVLQGGGALGAYELGAARRLYRDAAFRPDVIAGVSIGAITAVLLARPAAGLTPLQALEKFWQLVTVSGWFLPPAFQQYASIFGNPNFYAARHDVLNLPNWTYIYDTTPLLDTLRQLVNVEALADPRATPRLMVSATDITQGQITYFDSADHGLTLDHIRASGSLPPSFPATTIDGVAYWDGGLFDNTPLGAVIDRLQPAPGAKRVVYVVNLFPNRTALPRNMLEVYEHLSNLQFANKTYEDVKLMRRFNEVVALVEALDKLPKDDPAFSNKDFQAAFAAVKSQDYVAAPDIIEITRPELVGGTDGSDFSADTIEKRAAEGYRQAERALRER